MRLVYLAAPLTPRGSETREGNMLAAIEVYKELCELHADCAFLLQWVINCAVFEETTENRAVGIARNLAVIAVCDELWLVGPRVSAGMTAEATYAVDHGVRVRDYTERAEWSRTE